MSEAKNIIVLTVGCLLFLSCTSVGKKAESRPVDNPITGTHTHREIQHRTETIKSGALDHLIEKYWGSDYKMGAEGPNRFDCSGFVKRIFWEAYSFKLPRSSREQFKIGRFVNKSELEYADLVFFTTNGRKTVSHVGVYIGNGKFTHASTSVGVTISVLESDYYKKKYLGARRVIK